ncbi:MAG: rRNA pseudouridine synthase [Clostridia bacterium]|nr:rRNA pseudouridine synthase [Clostridia bacterium]
MEKIRIDKFLSSQLNISRTDAKKLLRGGQVTVNGEKADKAELPVDADRDAVAVGGKAVGYKKHLYIMMNKPAGVVSASRDENEKTVIDLLPEPLRRAGLFPAGRLDKDTTGFVLITDDGAFAHDILSPRRHVPKNYTVWTQRALTDAETERFRGGMTVGDTVFEKAEIEPDRYDPDENRWLYSVTIREGRYHQLKIMFAALGAPLVRLRRNRIGGLALDPSLLPGQARELTPEEVSSVKG